jgi:hypothetical protein
MGILRQPQGNTKVRSLSVEDMNEIIARGWAGEP